MSRRSRRKASENSASASFGGVFQSDENEELQKEVGMDRELIVEVNAQNWTKASNILMSLSSRRTPPLDSGIFDRVLIGLCKKKKSRKAIQLYTKIKSDQVKLSYFTYHLLFQAALKESAFNVVRKLHKDMNKDGHSMNPITCTLVITGLLRDKRKGISSRKLAYEIWCRTRDSSTEFDVKFFRAGCNACVSVRRMREAEELIPILRQKGFRPDIKFYNTLIKGYCEMQLMKSALNTVESMKREDIRPDQITYNKLIHGFVQCNELEKAERFFKLSRSEGFRPDVWTYTTLIDGFLQKTKLVKAREFYEDFKKDGGKPNKVMHSVFINHYIDQRNLPLAYKQLAIMKQEGLKPNLVVYNTLLKGYAEIGTSSCYPEIIKILSEMQSNGITPGVDTFNTLLSGFMDSQDLTAVQRLVSLMLQLGLEPDGVSYNYLMKLSSHNFEDIFENIEVSEDVEVDVTSWNLLTALFSQSRNLSKAEVALQGAVEYATSHQEAIPVQAFGAIIKGYINSNDLTSAIAKFRWFCKLGGQPDSKMMEELISACINKGDSHHALKLLRASKFLDKELDLEKYRRLILRKERKGVNLKGQQKTKLDANITGFETLKFWLGMPNNHYSSDWP